MMVLLAEVSRMSTSERGSVVSERVMHDSGSFSYLPGGLAFSNGVLAEKDHRISEWEFAQPLPLASAFDRVGEELRRVGSDWTALVGVDLRSPVPFTPEGFARFNDDYLSVLGSHYPLTDGQKPPFVRTNVSPIHNHLSEPCVRAVQVVQLQPGHQGDFVLSGVAENRGAPTPENTVAYDDVSDSGMRAKVEFVATTLATRLAQLGLSGQDARIVDVYTTHRLDWLADELTRTFGAIGRFGVHYWLASPPVTELEFEMGVKSISRRLILT